MPRRNAALQWTLPLLRGGRLASVALLAPLLAAGGSARAPIGLHIGTEPSLAPPTLPWTLSLAAHAPVIFAPVPALVLVPTPPSVPELLPAVTPADPQPPLVSDRLAMLPPRLDDPPVWADDAPILKADLLPAVPHDGLSDKLPPPDAHGLARGELPSVAGVRAAAAGAHAAALLTVPELPVTLPPEPLPVSQPVIQPVSEPFPQPVSDPTPGPLPVAPVPITDPVAAPVPQPTQPAPEPALLPLLTMAALLPTRRRSRRPASPDRSRRGTARR